MAYTGPVYTKALGEAILKTLRENVPFITFAAEANGVSRNTVKSWLRYGDEGSETFREFAVQVRKVRAEYILKTSLELMALNNYVDAAIAKQKAWLLERLDREQFSPVKVVERTNVDEKARARAKGQALTADHPDVKAAADDLETPEPHGVH